MLMVDAGWAGTLPALTSELKRYKISLSAIRWLMITHHHPDHAGLAQEIKKASGARLVIHEIQIPYLTNLSAFYQQKDRQGARYIPLQLEPDDLIIKAGHRNLMRQLGIQGEVIETPGHSDDSVSLVLDSGSAFVGDLSLPFMAEDENAEQVRASWKSLIQRVAQTIYLAHAQPFPVSQILSHLR